MSWTIEADTYQADMTAQRAAYHRGRLDTAHRLLAKASLPHDARVLDFGCGEGMFMAELGYAVEGMDSSSEMISLARARGLTADIGGAFDISGEWDAIVALNVLAYLTDEEHEAFWDAARQSRWVLVSHSNELFDLFAHDTPPPDYNIRVNPLRYASELEERGFIERDRAFFNFHPKRPFLLGPGDEGRVFDPNQIAALGVARKNLQCSTYFSLAEAI